MAEKTLDKIVVEYVKERDTKRMTLFKDELGEQSYSDQDYAVNSLYVHQQALELIGTPAKLRITIEPIE